MTDNAPLSAPPSPVAPPQRLTRPDASRYLREVHGLVCATATLAKYASVGGGPLYRRFGHQVFYAPADLDAWARSRISPTVATASELKR